MPLAKCPIVPCLWFDNQAEEAANYYLSIFPNSKITAISRYSEVGREFHGKEPGTVLTVELSLDGQTFTALNGGPIFKFNEAVSLQIMCDTQAEIDHYWDKLSAGGDPAAQQCGWLKDKYGLSWQVAPKSIAEMMTSPDAEKTNRMMAALFGMKKLDKATLEAAFAG
jgi:predicted 3-demethylubiquinone-9 3-methyltransferase (glyoxalase superfamily)